MKVLLTGSEGFVGKVLVANLLASGHEINGIDRAKEENPSYRLHRIDLKDKILLEEIQLMHANLAFLRLYQ
ncbi:NAD-dependent epimerase/dehydratase family protein [archaeon]|nr:NAD-dependent epimerase/dehydratase family protein [archaeon]